MTTLSVSDPLATNAWKKLLARTCGTSFYLEALSNLDNHDHADWYRIHCLILIDYEDMLTLHRFGLHRCNAPTLKRLVPAQ